MPKYDNIDGVARKVIKRYDNIDGVARKIIKEYENVDGVARKYFSSNLFRFSNSTVIGDKNATTVYDIYSNINEENKQILLRVYVNNRTTSAADGYVSRALAYIYPESSFGSIASKTISFTLSISGLSSYRDFYLEYFNNTTGLISSSRMYSSNNYSYTIPANTDYLVFDLTNCASGAMDVNAIISNIKIDNVSIFD